MTIAASLTGCDEPNNGVTSAFGTFETCRLRRAMSEFEGKAEIICSY